MNNIDQFNRPLTHKIFHHDDDDIDLIHVEITEPGEFCGLKFYFDPDFQLINCDKPTQGFRMKFSYQIYHVANENLLERYVSGDENTLKQVDIAITNILMSLMINYMTLTEWGKEHGYRANNSIQPS